MITSNFNGTPVAAGNTIWFRNVYEITFPTGDLGTRLAWW
jgi:hypothetical protein